MKLLAVGTAATFALGLPLSVYAESNKDLLEIGQKSFIPFMVYNTCREELGVITKKDRLVLNNDWVKNSGLSDEQLDSLADWLDEGGWNEYHKLKASTYLCSQKTK